MNIVVGLTSRPESRAALDRAIGEAKLRSARLHIVRTMGEGLTESESRTRYWASDVGAAQEEGEKLVSDLAAQGMEATFRVEPVSRDPASVLLRYADEVDARLIVIGIRRRSPIGKLVLGSVSQAVLLGAECPVIAVKPRPEDDSA